MVRGSTIVTVTIAGECKGLTTSSDLLAQVVAELGLLPLPVVASTITAGNPVMNAITFNWLHYSYSASVTVSTPPDYYDSLDDVGADVAGAFEDIAGSTPTAVQVSTPGRTPAIADPAGSDLGSELAKAVREGLTGAIGLLVLAVIGFVLAEKYL